MFVFFFVFKQKTAYEMRISDWSSDVCSSDLSLAAAAKVYTRIMAPSAPAQSSSHVKDSQMKKLIDDVEQLIDRESIRQLPIIYCHYVRQKTIDAFVDLSKTGGKLILSDDLGNVAQDSDELRKFLEKSISTAIWEEIDGGKRGG